MVHDLDIKVLLAEQIMQSRGHLAGLIGLVPVDQIGHQALCAPAQSDQALAMFGEHLQIDPRLVVKTLQVTDTGQLDQVPVALLVLSQQSDVVRHNALFGCPVFSVPGGDIGFHADNRLQTSILGRGVELNCSEKVAVVGESNSRHAELCSPGYQWPDLGCAVKKAVVRVVVKVNEGFIHCLRVILSLPDLQLSFQPETVYDCFQLEYETVFI